MTVQYPGKLTARLAEIPYGKIMLATLSLFSMLLMLKNCDIAIEYMKNGLLLCARTVIPSLFPFMVISEIIVSSGAGEYVGSLVAKPARWLFNISPSGACAVFLGAVCGFPVGARSAVQALDNGFIDKTECAHLLTFSNNPSSAFIISAVGASLLGNRTLGLVLWLLTVITSLICGFVMRLILYRTSRAKPKVTTKAHTVSGVSTFTKALTSSTGAMLTVCAYVVFFSAFIGALGSALETVTPSPTVKALLFSFFELSSGASLCSELEGGASLPALAAALGWSGISVHCQIITVCEGRGVSFRPYFFAKLLQALLSLVGMLLLLHILPPELTGGVESIFGSPLS
ncbi:MAG: hypothetical protein IKA82_03515 [Clostridia bacterium]|nr:hypothetical protein [Clostridia bacterium]